MATPPRLGPPTPDPGQSAQASGSGRASLRTVPFRAEGAGRKVAEGLREEAGLRGPVLLPLSAGETRRHLLLSPLCPHGREAHRHRPGGQKPEEDGRGRAVRCAEAANNCGAGRSRVSDSGSRSFWVSEDLTGERKVQAAVDDLDSIWAQREGGLRGLWAVSVLFRRASGILPGFSRVRGAIRFLLPPPRSVCQGPPAAGRQKGAEEENHHQEEHSEPLLQRGLQL